MTICNTSDILLNAAGVIAGNLVISCGSIAFSLDKTHHDGVLMDQWKSSSGDVRAVPHRTLQYGQRDALVQLAVEVGHDHVRNERMSNSSEGVGRWNQAHRVSRETPYSSLITRTALAVLHERDL